MSENESPEPKATQRGGMPGDGAGRREEPGHTGVYPMSGPEAPEGEAVVRNQESWGQGAAGEAGYEDSGTSEVIPDERLGKPGSEVIAGNPPAESPGQSETSRVVDREEGADALGE